MLSFEFNSSKNTISDLQIKNSLVQMNFSDVILVNQLRGILLKMPTYEAEIKKIPKFGSNNGCNDANREKTNAN